MQRTALADDELQREGRGVVDKSNRDLGDFDLLAWDRGSRELGAQSLAREVKLVVYLTGARARPSVQSPLPMVLMKFALVSEMAAANMKTAMRAEKVALMRRTALRSHLESSSYALRRVSRLNGMRMMAGVDRRHGGCEIVSERRKGEGWER